MKTKIKFEEITTGPWIVDQYGHVYGEYVPLSEIQKRAVYSGLHIRSCYDVAKVRPCVASMNFNAKPRDSILISKAPELLNICEELLAWAKSVEGHSVSRNITNGKDSIFETARKIIKEIKE